MKRRIVSLIAALSVILGVMTSCSLRIAENIEGDMSDTTHEIDNHLITINNNIFSYQIALDYVVYTLPCRLSEFLDNGWECETDYFTATNDVSLTKKGVRIYADLYCDSKQDEHDYRDYVVYSVSIFDVDEEMNIVLPGGLQVHQNTTEAQIIAAYGEPVYSLAGIIIVYCVGTKPYANSVCFDFSTDGGLYCITIDHRGGQRVEE